MPTDSGFGEAVIISQSKGDPEYYSSFVYCLNVSYQMEQEPCCIGEPFLLKQIDSYNDLLNGWLTQKLRENRLEVGSIISYRRKDLSFIENTGKKMEMSEILSQLQFKSEGKSRCTGVAYRGIAEAFPYVKIANFSESSSIYPGQIHFALVSIRSAWIGDGRILLGTQLGEDLNLRNRCRDYQQSSIEVVELQVQEMFPGNTVGDVALIGFGTTCTCKNDTYQAVCEGILLNSDHSKQAPSGPPKLPRYKMNSNPRGYCVIINNIEFSDKRMNRESSVYDEELLRKLFKDLSFTVVVKQDLKYNEILDTATKFAREDHSAFDAFVMIILSHGTNGDSILGINGRKISIADVMSEFKPANCPTLLNKPKVFFIQACRGESNEQLVAASDRCDGLVADTLASDSAIARTASPSEVDFLLASSTTPGYVSWRHHRGSIYVEILVEVIREFHHHFHLNDMLTEVTNRVTERGRIISQTTDGSNVEKFWFMHVCPLKDAFEDLS